MIKSAINKEVKSVVSDVKDVEKKIKDLKLEVDGDSVKEAVKPLVDKSEDIEDDIKKAQKVRDNMQEDVEKLGTDISDAHKSISKAAKGAANGEVVKNAQDEVAKAMDDMKKHAVTGINKAGKVVVKNQKYLKAIYKDLHHVK